MVEDISSFSWKCFNSRTGNRGVQSMTHIYFEATSPKINLHLKESISEVEDRPKIQLAMLAS